MGHKLEVRRKGRKEQRKDWEWMEVQNQPGQGDLPGPPKEHGGGGKAAVVTA